MFNDLSEESERPSEEKVQSRNRYEQRTTDDAGHTNDRAAIHKPRIKDDPRTMDNPSTTEKLKSLDSKSEDKPSNNGVKKRKVVERWIRLKVT